MAGYPDTRQDKLSWTSGLIKIHNLHMLSVKNDNFDAEMNHDPDEDSKDLVAVFINSDSENLNFLIRISKLLRYILCKENPSTISRITRQLKSRIYSTVEYIRSFFIKYKKKRSSMLSYWHPKEEVKEFIKNTEKKKNITIFTVKNVRRSIDAHFK